MVAPNFTLNFSPAAGEATPREARSAQARREALHDVGLVQRFNAGDESAFVEIVARYRERLSQVAWRMLRNHADAEEIAQDTFIRAHRSLALFRGDSSLYSWLHRITLNLSRNRYWYFSRRKQHLTQSLDSPVGEHSTSVYADLVASADPGPVRAADLGEFTGLVAACLARMNPGQRAVLQLRNAQNLPYREIARQLDIDLGTVKSRIGRARERLRTLLAEAYAVGRQPRAAVPPAWFEPARSAGLIAIVQP